MASSLTTCLPESSVESLDIGLEERVISLLRQRNYGLLWFGQVISVAGDWVLFASLPFYVYSLTGSALATGAMFMISMLPRVLLASVAGVFVDRWDRRWTMIAADLARAVLLTSLLAVHSLDQMWIIYLAAVAEAAVSQFFEPAKNALVPSIVTEGELVKANSLSALGGQVARLSGPAIGGLMLTRLGLPSVVIFDMLSFAFSAVMLWLLALAPGASRAQASAVVEAAGAGRRAASDAIGTTPGDEVRAAAAPGQGSGGNGWTACD